MSDIRRGILMGLVSYGLMTCADAIIKLLGNNYGVLQIIVLNCSFALASIGAIALLRGRFARTRPKRWRIHALRGVVTFATTVLNVWSFVHLPLAQVYAVLFSAPLFASILSALFLKERLSPHLLISVFLGVIGVWMIIDPFNESFDWRAAVPLAGALGMSANIILLRRLALDRESAESTGTMGNLFVIALASALVLSQWQPLPGPDLAISAIGGIVTGGAFLMLASAFHLAPASRIAPMQFVQLPLAMVIDWLCFSKLPSVMALAGAAVVLFSCILALREIRHQIP